MPHFRCENIIRAALDIAVKDFLERVINSGIDAFSSLYFCSFPIPHQDSTIRITAVLITSRHALPYSPPAYGSETYHKTQQICCKSVTPNDFEEAYQSFLQQLPASGTVVYYPILVLLLLTHSHADDDLTITAVLTTV